MHVCRLGCLCYKIINAAYNFSYNVKVKGFDGVIESWNNVRRIPGVTYEEERCVCGVWVCVGVGLKSAPA